MVIYLVNLNLKFTKCFLNIKIYKTPKNIIYKLFFKYLFFIFNTNTLLKMILSKKNFLFFIQLNEEF